LIDAESRDDLGVCVVVLPDTVLHVNAALVATLGAHNFLPGSRLKDLSTRLADAVAACAPSAGRTSRTIEIPPTAECPHWWTVSAYAMGGGSGERAGVTVVVLNEGGRRDQQWTHRARELEVLAANVPAFFSFVDTELRYRYLNRHYERAFGKPLRELMGQRVEDFMDDASFAILLPAMQRALGGEDVTMEVQLADHPLGMRSVILNYRPDISPDGTIGGFYALVQDVTDLRQSELQVRRLLESGPDARIVVDSKGHIVAINAQTTQLFGYRAEDLIGQAMEVLIPPGLQVGHKSMRDAYLANPEGRRVRGLRQLELAHKDGRRIPVEIHLQPIQRESGALVSASVRDITERVRLEDQLRQAQKMEAVGQLAGGIAHDFNNLLSVIVGNLTLMVRDGGARRTTPHPDQDRMLDDMLRSSRHAAAMTKQLLMMSRDEGTRSGVADVEAVVLQMESLLASTLGETVSLETRISPGLRPVQFTSSRLEQLLLNLVLNARDAVGRRGLVTITVWPGEDGAAPTPAGEHVAIRVADDGVGMTPRTVERIFEPFFTTKARGTGTGLGLSTVRAVVVDAGGTVHVDSIVGNGTSVTVRLPMVGPGYRIETALPEPLSNESNGETVLLCDDDDMVRRVFRRILEVAGYSVVEVADPRDAAGAIERHDAPIQLLLLDVVMPNVTGPELALALRELHPEIPILFVSGYAVALADALRLPGVRFLRKPVDPDVLLDTIKAMVGSYTASAHG